MWDYIDNTVRGIIEEVGTNNVYDILSHLDISLIKDNSSQNPLLKSCEGLYLRDLNGKEIIIVRDDLINEKFIIAHELGHALLHTEYDTLLHNKHTLPGRIEKEAYYFATKLLFSDLNLKKYEDYNTMQVSKILKVNEDVVEYLVRE